MIPRSAIALLAVSSVAFCQTDAGRDFWEGVLLSHRTPVAGHNRPRDNQNAALLGVTIWHVPSRKPVKPPFGKPAGSPGGPLERLTGSSGLNRGEQFRMMIEPARSGYLYVFKHAGMLGKTDSTELIYPSGGFGATDNHVDAGSVAMIPAVSSPPAFLTASGGTLDKYTVLLTPHPIRDVGAANGDPYFDAALLANWKNVWNYPAKLLTTAFPMALSPAETEVLSGRSNTLTQSDPPPQDLYHSDTPPGEPMIVDLGKTFVADVSDSRLGGSLLGSFHGLVSRPPAQTPVATSRVTASAFLTTGQDEPTAGLYSYILFGSRPESFDSPRWNRYFQTILAYLNLPAASDFSKYLPPETLNLTFFPLMCSTKELPASSMQPVIFQFTPERIEAHRMEHQAAGKPFTGHGKSNADTACALVSSYDYSRAQRLLALLPGGSHLEGPYIVSTAQPLSKASELPAQYLYQDLSSVPPSLVGLWFREFMAQAQEPEFWKTRSSDQFVLRLRTVIGIASEQVPDFKSSVVWAFIGPSKK